MGQECCSANNTSNKETIDMVKPSLDLLSFEEKIIQKEELDIIKPSLSTSLEETIIEKEDHK